ncbi:PBSX family phage terminase large subunit [Desulfovibrio caledoniensis]
MEPRQVKLQIPSKFQGLFRPYRYKVFHGGRGGAKSRSFARALIFKAAEKPLRVLCAREIQKSIKDSVKRLLDDEIGRMGMRHLFVSTESEIRGVNGSLFIFSGLRLNPEQIKSFEGVDICWIEEAEAVSERSWRILKPTLRKDGSEIWLSFNPESIMGVIYQEFIANDPPFRSLVVQVNYCDNPWFPDVLREEMEACRAKDEDEYRHVWLGEPVLMSKGSYYGKLLDKAKAAGRVTRVPYDPALLVHTSWDLGVHDSTAIWFFQYHRAGPAGERRYIDYYESSGEGLPHYAQVLQQKGYNYGQHIGPHDIKVREWGGSGSSRWDTALKLGIRFDICPNIPVADGIEAARNAIHASWFDSEHCERGLKALWAYQREWDEINSCFKNKPLHDWSSNGADSFRYSAVGFRPPSNVKLPERYA